MLCIHELINLYNDLDNAIFFDGKITNEFVNIGRYTPNQWIKKADQFLEGYQRVLEQNTAVAKHDYLLRASEYETRLAYFGEPISRTTMAEQHSTLQDDLLNNRPDEPFDGYFELIRKMSIPFDALKKAQEETGDYSISSIPIVDESIKEFGAFIFIISDEKAVDVKYKGKKLSLQPKETNTFFCVMSKCYDNNETISMDEIREFNKKPADSEQSIRSQTSKINDAIREIANLSKDDKLIVNANEVAPRMFKLNYKLLACI